MERLLNKDRIDDAVDDGRDVAESHAEIEFALSEIFGIELGMRITDAIFGEYSRNTVGAPYGNNMGVNYDGSWTFLRFSSSGSTSPAAASGIEFADGARTVRLIQVGSNIRLYEKVGTSWVQKMDFEYIDPNVKLTDLEDVSITESDLNEDNVGLCVGVKGTEQEGFVWTLLHDTLTNGVTTWDQLGGVEHPDSYPLAPPNTVWQSNGTDLVSPINISGQKKVASAFSTGPIIMQVRTPYYLSWNKRYAVPTGYEAILLGSGYFVLSVPGIYKCNLGWQMNSGSTLARDEAGRLTPSKVNLYMAIQGSLLRWPPMSTTLCDEVWWEHEDMAAAGGWATRLALVDEDLGSGQFGMAPFYVISQGGADAKFKLMFYHSAAGGDRVMTFDLDIERVS